MSNRQTTSNYRSEIQVAISTLVAGLGFFKAQELTDFIHILKSSTIINTISFSNLFDKIGIASILLPFFGILLYFAYLICVGFSLYCVFRQRPAKQHQNSILYAVICYFCLQFLLITVTFADKPDDTSKKSKNIIIQMDSLYIHVPYDSITINKNSKLKHGLMIDTSK